jgi:hypothetical protein
MTTLFAMTADVNSRALACEDDRAVFKVDASSMSALMYVALTPYDDMASTLGDIDYALQS